MAEQADLALIAEADGVALDELLRRLHQRLPARAVETPDQRRLDLRLGGAPDAAPRELCCDHPWVGDDNLIAGFKPRRQIGYSGVAQDAVGVDHQHTRGIEEI